MDLRFSDRIVKLSVFVVLCAALSFTLKASPPKNGQGLLAINGQAAALIVAGDKARPSDRFVAGELQRHIERLSGAKIEVIESGNVRAAVRVRSEFRDSTFVQNIILHAG